MKPEPLTIHNQHLWLSPERSVYWEEERSLIVSDLHFGKTGHFRKSGIAVPQSLYKEDLHRLVEQIQFFKPQTLIVVGDLFHSNANKELELFRRWREDLDGVRIHLIKGNHDILKDQFYTDFNITLSTSSLKIGSFCFQHDPGQCSIDSNDEEEVYLFTGHVHPGIVISGLGKQSLRFPCFYFTDNYCILPAFSRFTGAASIDPKPGELVYAIVNNSIIKI